MNTHMQKICSVSEFVSAIEQQPNLCLFRGESSDFAETRLVSAMLLTSENQSNFKYRCNWLYKRVFSSITENEKEHFLAFAQHHGIPTNLLDVTTNPLISLWFACESSAGKNTDGIVYGFENNFIELTEYIDMIGTNYVDSRFYGDKEKWRNNFENAIFNSPTEISMEDALISLFSGIIASKENM